MESFPQTVLLIFNSKFVHLMDLKETVTTYRPYGWSSNLPSARQQAPCRGNVAIRRRRPDALPLGSASEPPRSVWGYDSTPSSWRSVYNINPEVATDYRVNGHYQDCDNGAAPNKELKSSCMGTGGPNLSPSRSRVSDHCHQWATSWIHSMLAGGAANVNNYF